jgi:hypothetical protein
MRVLYFWDYQNVPHFKWKVLELCDVHVLSLHFQEGDVLNSSKYGIFMYNLLVQMKKGKEVYT